MIAIILPHDLFGFDSAHTHCFLLGILTLEASEKRFTKAMAPKMFFTGAIKMLGYTLTSILSMLNFIARRKFQLAIARIKCRSFTTQICYDKAFLILRRDH